MSYDIESDVPVKTDKDITGLEQSTPNTSTLNMGSSPNPFSSSMNHVFFSGADRRILLDEVIHLCQFGNNLVAVVGDEGVGKTAFLNQARFELAETAFCCFIDASQLMSPEDIFSQIISQLELSISSVSTAGEMIATLRHAMAEGSMHRVVVIIDDAHQLNDSILSALISLLQGHQGQHLHILMAGEQDLVGRLDHFEMVDVLVYDVTLNPFTLEDTKSYLDFKLTTAGYTEEDILDDATVESIWKESQGLVAQVNRVAERQIFQQDLGIEEARSATGLPLFHMALLVLLLAALIFALVYMGGDDEVGENSVPEASAEAKEITLPIPTKSAVSPPALNEGTGEAQKNNEVISPKAFGEAPKPEVETSSENTVHQDEVKGSVSSTKEASQTLPVAPEKPTAEVSEKPKAEVVAKQPQRESLEKDLQQELQKEALLLKKAEEKKQASSNQSELTQDEKWLMALNDNSYVLQVIAAGQKESVKKFINSQPNKSALRLITIERQSKPWYVVVVGNYTDSDSARRAVGSLPQDQVNGGPWPRKVSSLKQEMDAVQSK